VHERLERKIDELKEAGIFFALSFTVTRSNFAIVTDLDFVSPSVRAECRLFFFAAYTPVRAEGDVSATVEVTGAGGKVTGLRLVEGRNIEPSVADALFAAVRDAKSTAGDAVSGATATSNVVLKAIEAATKQ